MLSHRSAFLQPGKVRYREAKWQGHGHPSGQQQSWGRTGCWWARGAGRARGWQLSTRTGGKRDRIKLVRLSGEKNAFPLAWGDWPPCAGRVNSAQHLKKNGSFLIIIEAEIYNLLYSLAVSIKSADKAFAEIVENLQNHLSSESLVMIEHFCFYKENLKENEHF